MNVGCHTFHSDECQKIHWGEQIGICFWLNQSLVNVMDRSESQSHITHYYEPSEQCDLMPSNTFNTPIDKHSQTDVHFLSVCVDAVVSDVCLIVCLLRLWAVMSHICFSITAQCLQSGVMSTSMKRCWRTYFHHNSVLQFWWIMCEECGAGLRRFNPERVQTNTHTTENKQLRVKLYCMRTSLYQPNTLTFEFQYHHVYVISVDSKWKHWFKLM